MYNVIKASTSWVLKFIPRPYEKFWEIFSDQEIRNLSQTNIDPHRPIGKFSTTENKTRKFCIYCFFSLFVFKTQAVTIRALRKLNKIQAQDPMN